MVHHNVANGTGFTENDFNPPLGGMVLDVSTNFNSTTGGTYWGYMNDSGGDTKYLSGSDWPLLISTNSQYANTTRVFNTVITDAQQAPFWLQNKPTVLLPSATRSGYPYAELSLIDVKRAFENPNSPPETLTGPTVVSAKNSLVLTTYKDGSAEYTAVSFPSPNIPYPVYARDGTFSGYISFNPNQTIQSIRAVGWTGSGSVPISDPVNPPSGQTKPQKSGGLTQTEKIAIAVAVIVVVFIIIIVGAVVGSRNAAKKAALNAVRQQGTTITSSAQGGRGYTFNRHRMYL